ncbi:MAG: FtsH protease activity modulator HflK [Deltaproteobacteria bacterium]|jgi:membrane protease subunit HflK|nr:FtsH protease activity modulator HflK [Deltaproteobacteria bacterium]
MNWDWEKLEEKKQRQGKPVFSLGGGKPGNPFGGFQPGKYLPKAFKGGVPVSLVVAVCLLLWLLSGIFIVNPGEKGIVTRFGKFEREVPDGPHYRLPFPLESEIIVNTEQLRTIEVGISAENARRASQIKVEESSMFTGDENIVHMQFNVQYTIADARKYLFNVRDPSNMLTGAAEAAMREVVGRSNIDEILTSGRAVVQAGALTTLEEILGPYDMGVRVHTVQLLDVQPPADVEEAFKDVASAREDKVRFINQAEAYRNEIVPVANGTALGMLNAAAAYAQQVEQRAEGETGRFLAMAAEFNASGTITKKRLYLEAMESIFSSNGLEKIIVSPEIRGVLPFLNLDRTPPETDAGRAPR